MTEDTPARQEKRPDPEPVPDPVPVPAAVPAWDLQVRTALDDLPAPASDPVPGWDQQVADVNAEETGAGEPDPPPGKPPRKTRAAPDD